SLSQDAGDPCLFESAAINYPLTDNLGGSEDFIWVLSYTPSTWTLEMQDIGGTPIITFSGLAGPFDCAAKQAFPHLSTAAGQIDANYDFSVGAFCINP
ncbi:unnamed protein product, partial [marine sediment metagenome]